MHFLNAGFEGTHPLTDVDGSAFPAGSASAEWAGKPLCDGKVRVVIWAGTADLEFMGNDLGFPHFGSNDPCWLCPASRRHDAMCKITECSKNASFKHQCYTTEGPGLEKPTHHPVMDIPGMTRFHWPGDLMHTGSLGVVLYFLGSVFYELVYDGVLDRRPDAALEKLWLLIKNLYGRLGIQNRLSQLTLKMFVQSDAYPALGAKAAEGQALLPVVLEICKAYDDGSEHHAHRTRALQALTEFNNISKTASLVPSDEDAKAMVDAIDTHLLHSNWLLNRAISKNVLLYPLFTKHHLLWHIADQAKWLNPRACWAFEFEDFLGDMVQSAKACLAGTPMDVLGNKVLENYTLLLELTLQM